MLIQSPLLPFPRKRDMMLYFDNLTREECTMSDEIFVANDGVGIYSALPRVAESLSPHSTDGSVNLNIDVNALITSIVSAINSNSERGAFVKSTLEKLISNTQGQHNIMIFNMHQEYEFNPDRQWSWYNDQVFAGIRYGFWVFRGPVRFVNKGDGGWINWGFYGQFERNGGIVDFQ